MVSAIAFGVFDNLEDLKIQLMFINLLDSLFRACTVSVTGLVRLKIPFCNFVVGENS